MKDKYGAVAIILSFLIALPIYMAFMVISRPFYWIKNRTDFPEGNKVRQCDCLPSFVQYILMWLFYQPRALFHGILVSPVELFKSFRKELASCFSWSFSPLLIHYARIFNYGVIVHIWDVDMLAFIDSCWVCSGDDERSNDDIRCTIRMIFWSWCCRSLPYWSPCRWRRLWKAFPIVIERSWSLPTPWPLSWCL